ncbi:MAG: hypothetical protein MZW92_43375, partial [Comamonadaceae bacterium]|nr:hypothetical protein [Comamonadaceae bacterium]
FDYLPEGAVLCLHRDVLGADRDFWRDTRGRYDLLKGDRTRPVPAPRELFLDEEAFFVAARALGRVAIAAPDGEQRRASSAAGHQGGAPCGRSAAPPQGFLRRLRWPHAHRRRVAGPARDAAGNAAGIRRAVRPAAPTSPPSSASNAR